jgi:hypothetical protein
VLKGIEWAALYFGSLFHLPKTCGSINKPHSIPKCGNVVTTVCLTESGICYIMRLNLYKWQSSSSV